MDIQVHRKTDTNEIDRQIVKERQIERQIVKLMDQYIYTQIGRFIVRFTVYKERQIDIWIKWIKDREKNKYIGYIYEQKDRKKNKQMD